MNQWEGKREKPERTLYRMYEQCLLMFNCLLIAKQYLLAVCGNNAVIYTLLLIRANGALQVDARSNV